MIFGSLVRMNMKNVIPVHEIDSFHGRELFILLYLHDVMRCLDFARHDNL